MGWLLKQLAGKAGVWIVAGVMLAIAGCLALAGLQTVRLKSCQLASAEGRAAYAEAETADLREAYGLAIEDVKAVIRSANERDARLRVFSDSLDEVFKDDACADQPLPRALRRELCLAQGGNDCETLPD